MVEFQFTQIRRNPIKQKVAIYIFDAELKHVLTFLQPDSPGSGRQVPAGTLEKGEMQVDAAARELSEETGHTKIPELIPFARSFYDMNRYKPEVHDRSWFFGVNLAGDLPKNGWTHIEDTPGGDQIRAVFEWVPVETSSDFIAGHGHLLPLALELAGSWLERDE